MKLKFNITLTTFILLMPLFSLGQKLKHEIVVNDDITRFYNANDRDTIRYSYGGTGIPTKIYKFKDSSVFFANVFSKQAYFLVDDLPEDSVDIGYWAAKPNIVKHALVLASFDYTMNERIYGTISSSEHIVAYDLYADKEASTIGLMVAFIGDTLYYDPQNKANYIYNEGGGHAFISLSSNLTVLGHQLVLNTKPSTAAGLFSIMGDNKGNYLFHFVLAAGDTFFGKNYSFSHQLPNTKRVNSFALLAVNGDVVWHSHIVTNNSAFAAELNNIRVSFEKAWPKRIGFQFHSSPSGTIDIYKNNSLVRSLDSDVSAYHKKSVTYLAYLDNSGDIALYDTLTHLINSNTPYTTTTFKYFNESVVQLPTDGDSCMLVNGLSFCLDALPDFINYLRAGDYTLMPHRLDIHKTGDYYYSLPMVQTVDVDFNFAYLQDSTLKCQYKAQGSDAKVLTIYDKDYDALWSRSLTFLSLSDLYHDSATTILYGNSFSPNQELEPDITGNALVDLAHKICIYDCVPIAYFRVGDNDEYIVPFENLSHQQCSYSWDFGDSTTSEAKNPIHTFPKNGKYQFEVTLIVTNYCGQDTFKKIVYLDPNKISTRNNLSVQPLRLYPNPVSSGQPVHIEGLAEGTDYELSIVNVMGQNIMYKKINGDELKTSGFKLPQIAPGPYIFSVKSVDSKSIYHLNIIVIP